MTQLLELRSRLVAWYQRFDIILLPLMKFTLVFISYMRLSKMFGFNNGLTGFMPVLLLSLVSSIISLNAALIVMIIYIVVLLYSVSWIMSLTVLALSLILYCFFIRLVPRYSGIIIAMPIMTYFGIPYVLPIGVGLFAGISGIIPCSIGVFAYYLLGGIRTNISLLEQLSDSQNVLKVYNDIMTSLLTNYDMFATILAFAAVVLVMNQIKNISMDYSFEISVAAGAVTNMLVHIILMLNWELKVSILRLIVLSFVSGLLVLIAELIYRPLYYAGTERVKFEDDDYYYYVKAVPKLKMTGVKVKEKHFITKINTEDEVEEELDIND